MQRHALEGLAAKAVLLSASSSAMSPACSVLDLKGTKLADTDWVNRHLLAGGSHDKALQHWHDAVIV